MSRIKIAFDDNTSVSLESQLERLSLEAFTLPNVIETFRHVIPNFTDSLNTKIKAIAHPQENNLFNDIKQYRKELDIKLRVASYVNYDKTLVSIPEGFTGNFLDFVNMLNSVSANIYTEVNTALTEYNLALSSFITNRSDKTALKNYTDLFHKVKARRESVSEMLSKYFTNKTNSKAYLGMVINKFGEVEPLLVALEKLNNNHHLDDLKNLTSAVNATVDLLNVIVEGAKTGDTEKLSGNAAMSISTGAYELGKYVEFVAIYRYRIEQINASVKNLVVTLNTIL